MMESEYLSDPFLISSALDCIWAVLQVRGPTPLNHYCRLLSRADLAVQLLRCIRLMIAAARAAAPAGDAARRAPPGASSPSSGSSAQTAAPASSPLVLQRTLTHLTSACDLLLVLSHSDSVVKALTGRVENVQAMLDTLEDLPAPLVLKALAVLRNLSSDPQSMRQMQKSGAVRRMVALLKKGSTGSRVGLSPPMQLHILEVRPRQPLYSLASRSIRTSAPAYMYCHSGPQDS